MRSKNCLRHGLRAVLILLIAGVVIWLSAFQIAAPGMGTLPAGSDTKIPYDPMPVRPVLQKPDFTKAFSDFKKKNKDCVGWLYIPGTDINDEVVQSTDNDYYLRRTSMGVYYTNHGCYFADFRNNLRKQDTPDRNVIIYGHNILDDGEKFSQLLAYADWTHFSSYPYLYFYTETGLHVYRIVAAYYTFVDFYYIETNPDAERWRVILDESHQRSQFHTGLETPVTGHYITLSTCCNKYRYSWGGRRHDQRFVVLGMEIDPENPPAFTLPIKNPKIKEPTD